MQQGQVGWDLISLERQMPWEDKAFVLYLVVVLVFSLLRSLRLAWNIWFFSARGVSTRQVKLDAANQLVANALANRLPSPANLPSGGSAPSNKEERAETPCQVVENARPKFEYLGEKCVTRVAAMKDLAFLAVILSGLVISRDLMSSLTTLQIPRRSEIDVAGGPAEMLVPLVLGFAVSALVYALSSVYSGALARRRAEWNLFVAKVYSQTPR
jgi:hypothetical protein